MSVHPHIQAAVARRYLSLMVAIALAMIPAISSAGNADNAVTPTTMDSNLEKNLGLGEYSGTAKANEMDKNAIRNLEKTLGINDGGDGAPGSAGAGAAVLGGIAGGLGGMGGGSGGSPSVDGSGAQAASMAYTASIAAMIGRQGDIFVFCYEGGEGGAASQGWYPVLPAAGTYVITRWCTGAPCPNWNTLTPYMTLCPQALSVGLWAGPDGPGVIGQYQSSGGSKNKGEPNGVNGLSPLSH